MFIMGKRAMKGQEILNWMMGFILLVFVLTVALVLPILFALGIFASKPTNRLLFNIGLKRRLGTTCARQLDECTKSLEMYMGDLTKVANEAEYPLVLKSPTGLSCDQQLATCQSDLILLKQTWEEMVPVSNK